MLLKIDAERVASALFHSYARNVHAGRPTDRRLTRAEFEGMCKAVSALGLDGNEFTVIMAVQRVCDELGAVPLPDPVAPTPFKDYRDRAVPGIVEELEELFTLDMTMPGWREALSRRQ